jgi:DNA repair exonuclease SbcCD ATPase subunit
MRFITFKNLKAKNFLSFGDSLVNIELKKGVNSITGINLDKEDSKNGAGKSAITEILYYALYGTTLREISKDFVQNSITKKPALVELELEVKKDNITDLYTIVRQLNPTKCKLFKNNEDITRSTLAKTNALIQSIIRSPSTVFQNSVIMSINNALPFMALSKVDKRKFIESVLGLEVFTSMLLKIRDDYSISKKDYDLAYSKLETLETELLFNVNQFETYETRKAERLTKLSEKESKLKSELEQTLTNLNSIKILSVKTIEEKILSLEKKITEKETEINNFSKTLHKNQAALDSEQNQIQKLLGNKDLCPTCNREFSQGHRAHIETLIENHNKEIQKFQETINKTNKILAQETEQKNNLKQAKQLLEQEIIKSKTNQANQNALELNIIHFKKSLDETKEEILIANKEHNNELKGKITLLGDEVKKSKEKLNNLNNELNILETVKFILSEEGIKSFIVKKIIKVLNSRIAYYLQKLEANCLCQFNEYFEEEIIDEKGDKKSYFNFSGGERKRIDLACLFAFADIRRLQGDVYFSTIFYDELIDSSLDDKGVQLTLQILKERFDENQESCYIITHRTSDALTGINHTITVVKENGISFIK